MREILMESALSVYFLYLIGELQVNYIFLSALYNILRSIETHFEIRHNINPVK